MMKRTAISLPPKTIIGYVSGKPIYNIAGGSEPLGGDPNDPGYTGGSGQQGTNPAWNEFLEVVPQEFHEKVTPILSKWDQGVQQRFEKVHSEWEPWKGIRESGVDPDTALTGINVLNALQNDPQAFYNALKEHYRFDQQQQTNINNGLPPGQGQQEPKEDDPFAPVNQQIEELRVQNQRMAEIMQAQYQERLNKEADVSLDNELTALKSKYGNFNEQFVLAQMMTNGSSAEDAVRAYHTWREQEIGTARPKPLLLGSGGGVPGNNVDPRKLSDKQTKNLVVEMLQAASQQE